MVAPRITSASAGARPDVMAHRIDLARLASPRRGTGIRSPQPRPRRSSRAR